MLIGRAVVSYKKKTTTTKNKQKKQRYSQHCAFSSFQKNLEMKVPLHSKLNLVCPNPASVLQQRDSSIPQEQMYENMWIVEKDEYDACKINTSHPSFSNEKKLLNCNNPLQLKYHEMVFRAFIAPGSVAAYQPGRSYYFIGKSEAPLMLLVTS